MPAVGAQESIEWDPTSPRGAGPDLQGPPPDEANGDEESGRERRENDPERDDRRGVGPKLRRRGSPLERENQRNSENRQDDRQKPGDPEFMSLRSFLGDCRCR